MKYAIYTILLPLMATFFLFTGCVQDKKPASKESVEIIDDAEKTSQKDSNDITGIYQSALNSDTYNASLTIKPRREGGYRFDLTTADQSGCTGEASGSFDIDDNRVGVWSGEDCAQLIFTFTSNRVKVQESECLLHGMKCAFEGDYTK